MLHRDYSTVLDEQGQPHLIGSGEADQSMPEVERLRRDLDKLLRQQAELMQLVGTTRADRLVHDIRNVLQERMLLEAACKRYGV